MSREEKLREIAEQEQALMREIYGFDNGVAWERERIIKLLKEHIALQIADDTDQDSLDYHEDTCGLCKNFHGLGVAIALINGEK